LYSIEQKSDLILSTVAIYPDDISKMFGIDTVPKMNTTEHVSGSKKLYPETLGGKTFILINKHTFALYFIATTELLWALQ
jgi:hypothetical protein